MSGVFFLRHTVVVCEYFNFEFAKLCAKRHRTYSTVSSEQ